jgi:hypothetical protein
MTLMVPEAYVLSAAINGWMKKESDKQIGRALRMLATSIT